MVGVGRTEGSQRIATSPSLMPWKLSTTVSCLQDAEDCPSSAPHCWVSQKLHLHPCKNSQEGSLHLPPAFPRYFTKTQLPFIFLQGDLIIKTKVQNLKKNQKPTKLKFLHLFAPLFVFLINDFLWCHWGLFRSRALHRDICVLPIFLLWFKFNAKILTCDSLAQSILTCPFVHMCLSGGTHSQSGWSGSILLSRSGSFRKTFLPWDENTQQAKDSKGTQWVMLLARWSKTFSFKQAAHFHVVQGCSRAA